MLPPRLLILMAGFLLAPCSQATLVPRLALEDLVQGSDYIVHGRIARSWTAWNEDHTLIWTHHKLDILDPLQLNGGANIVISEPGGVLDGIGMQVSGATEFLGGEEVIVFLHRTPLGYLRLTGWGQGKYSVASGRFINRAPNPRILDATSIGTFKARVRMMLGVRR